MRKNMNLNNMQGEEYDESLSVSQISLLAAKNIYFLPVRIDDLDRKVAHNDDCSVCSEEHQSLRVGALNNSAPFLRCFIDDLNISKKIIDWLDQIGVEYIGELVQVRESELVGIPGFYPEFLVEIKDALAKKGLYMGMRLDIWSSPISSGMLIW